MHGSCEDQTITDTKRKRGIAFIAVANIDHCLTDATGAPDISRIRRLIAAGADANQAEAAGYTPLHLAASKVNPAAIMVLLGAGANPSLRAWDGQPHLLHFRAKLRHR